jgi:hypothetical protein
MAESRQVRFEKMRSALSATIEELEAAGDFEGAAAAREGLERLYAAYEDKGND